MHTLHSKKSMGGLMQAREEYGREQIKHEEIKHNVKD
jgi:hypothetical protein